MFPPVPTNDPQMLLGNVWASLRRAADDHWGDQATVLPAPEGVGHVATLRTASAIDNQSWEAASKYIRGYAKASHWTVTGLKRQRGYVEMHLEYSPPKQRPARDQELQKTA